MRVDRGIVTAYDATNHKADVLLVGSLSRVALGVPVAYQVAPEQVAEDTLCGVVFFGEGDAGVVVCTFDEVPVPPLDLDAWGPTLDVNDLLGGHHDEFFGQALHPAYQTEVSSGTVMLRDAEHGGVVRLRANAGAGNWARLWLGDTAGGYDTLDADHGWVMLFRGRFTELTSTTMIFGGEGPGGTDRIWAGLISGEWKLRGVAGGSTTTTSTGISADTSRHRHAIEVLSSSKVNYYVDGVLGATVTTNVPTVDLTPIIYSYNGDAAAYKTMYCNYWGIMPRFVS
jgi:hypothetical protein